MSQVLGALCGGLLGAGILFLAFHLKWRSDFREFDRTTFWLGVGSFTGSVLIFLLCVVIAGYWPWEVPA